MPVVDMDTEKSGKMAEILSYIWAYKKKSGYGLSQMTELFDNFSLSVLEENNDEPSNVNLLHEHMSLGGCGS